MSGIWRAGGVLTVLWMASCTSPDPTYYTLQPTSGAILPGGGAGLIEVVRPGLAGYLDRSDIVLKQADYRLSVDSQVRWGEPLADMVGRVLAQDLTQRLPGSSVFSNDGAIGADPNVRVEINVQRFDAEADGSVRLVANVAVARGLSHTPFAAHAVMLQTAGGAGPGGLVAAMSVLLGELADQVASDIARG
jgi:uncharacterized lipoprotein YmbA